MDASKNQGPGEQKFSYKVRKFNLVRPAKPGGTGSPSNWRPWFCWFKIQMEAIDGPISEGQ